MRLHRFFVHEFFSEPLSAIPDGEVLVSDQELIHQWKDVFRLKAGDDVVLLDNTGNEYLSSISELHKKGARLHIAEISKSKNIPAKIISLYAALIKKNNFELILEKGTELGLSEFVPLLTDRCEKKDLNMERARKIITEASEQSGRGILPELSEIENLEEALEKVEKKLIAFDPTGETFDRNILTQTESSILVGPEGGWSERELKLFREKSISVYSIGSQVLRAETAAIALSSLFLL